MVVIIVVVVATVASHALVALAASVACLVHVEGWFHRLCVLQVLPAFQVLQRMSCVLVSFVRAVPPLRTISNLPRWLLELQIGCRCCA